MLFTATDIITGKYQIWGMATTTVPLGIGLGMVVMVNYVACELFRSRSNE